MYLTSQTSSRHKCGHDGHKYSISVTIQKLLVYLSLEFYCNIKTRTTPLDYYYGSCYNITNHRKMFTCETYWRMTIYVCVCVCECVCIYNIYNIVNNKSIYSYKHYVVQQMLLSIKCMYFCLNEKAGNKRLSMHVNNLNRSH